MIGSGPESEGKGMPAGGRRGLVGPAAVLILALSLYAVGASVIAGTRGVWSPDCGARMIQVFSILQHPPHWHVPYPAAELDPDHKNSALYFYEFRHGGQTYIFYSALFAGLSAIAFHLFGYIGLMVLPILGGLTSAAAAWGIARLVGFRSPWGPALLVALASPVAVYSTVFWDHSLITGLAAVALLLALRGVVTGRWALWFWAGVVIGAGLWIHELILPWAPALALGAWWLRKDVPWLRASLLLAGGTLLLAVPLGIANAVVYGTPLGPHLSNNELASAGSIVSFLGRPAEWTAGALYTLFFWGDNCAGFTPELVGWLNRPSPSFQAELRASMWMAVPMVLWVALALSGLWRRFWVVSLVVLAGVAAAGIWVLANDSLVHSLLLASPVLALAFAAPLRAPSAAKPADGAEVVPRRMLQMIALATAFYVVPVLIKPTLGGTEWGARHLLLIVPPLALLAWSATEGLLAELQSRQEGPRGARAGLMSGIAVLLVLSLALQGRGFHTALTMHQHSQAMTAVIEGAGDEVIVSSVWWAPLQAPAAYFDHRILYAGDPEHPAPALFFRMRQAGVPAYTLLGVGPMDLALFSAPAGYQPVAGAVRQIPFNLYMNRFRLAEVDAEALPRLLPPPGPAGNFGPE